MNCLQTTAILMQSLIFIIGQVKHMMMEVVLTIMIFVAGHLLLSMKKKH
jgi:hypothetical protein